MVTLTPLPSHPPSPPSPHPLHFQSQNDQFYLEVLGKDLDSYSSYDRIVLARYYNSEEKRLAWRLSFISMILKLLSQKILQNLPQLS